MPQDFSNKVFQRIRRWFDDDTRQVTLEFLPDPAASPLAPGEGYLRVWLVEGFLAKARTWGTDHYPALYAGVQLNFLGAGNKPTPFSLLQNRPTWKAPGAYLNFPVTTLLPYSGGTVEIDAALYRSSDTGPIGVAAKVVSGLTSLIGLPLGVVSTIADKVSDGLDVILDAQKEDPELGLHWTMVPDGGGGQSVRPGYLIVANTPQGTLPEDLTIKNDRLHGNGVPLEGVDFLVLRVECRAARDEYWLPELEELRVRAVDAYLNQQLETFENLRRTAIYIAMTCPDFSRHDRLRVAKVVTDRIDEVKLVGAVPSAESGLDQLTAADLPHIDEVRDLTLEDLLAN
ncbi:hypothetical protein [Lentzea flaviverrucosa]|uniref:Uncharacterized protein n=1 Tax=Lentzea flaviverrucosa TaxID=200379 RepID=A0A1H9CB49_9PSEU|nr:hypothetical protein [Lentzea flaviverrucosa]RDI24500.1 hypothetical protein DFR72_10980 [Lentzea flaviverrucosa]SEP98460.1 hypothetical protein SAMN05216195_101735 [Lentzea flaviverrucosa]